jgi:hypothetical protein
MPCRMGDERGEDDRPDSLGEHVSKHQLQHRHEDGERGKLAELDADVEGQQRRQQMRPGKLQRFAERKRKPEAVHESKRERRHPAACDAASRQRPR